MRSGYDATGEDLGSPGRSDGIYTVVIAKKLEKFIERVSELIGNGWEPQGGITISNGDVFCHAMIKRP
jgi:hypothetical protein